MVRTSSNVGGYHLLPVPPWHSLQVRYVRTHGGMDYLNEEARPVSIAPPCSPAAQARPTERLSEEEAKLPPLSSACARSYADGSAPPAGERVDDGGPDSVPPPPRPPLPGSCSSPRRAAEGSAGLRPSGVCASGVSPDMPTNELVRGIPVVDPAPPPGGAVPGRDDGPPGAIDALPGESARGEGWPWISRELRSVSTARCRI